MSTYHVEVDLEVVMLALCLILSGLVWRMERGKRAYMVDHLVRDTAVVLQDVVVHRAGGFGDLLCDGLLLKSS